MSALPVPPDDIHDRYRRVAETIAKMEKQITTSLPTAEPYGLANTIEQCITDWEQGRKSVRTIPVANAYAQTIDGRFDSELLDTLVGLDVTINVLDDIIDTKDPSTQQDIKHTANAAFATTLTHRNLPEPVREGFTRQLNRYYVELFQIPHVEAELVAKMESAESMTERVHFAYEVYRYRSRDVDAFARLPALMYGQQNKGELTDPITARLEADLRTHRARSLLFKDIRDIQRDYQDQDFTPVLSQLLNSQDPEVVSEFVDRVVGRMNYTTSGGYPHIEVLKTIENPPQSISTRLSDEFAIIQSGAHGGKS